MPSNWLDLCSVRCRFGKAFYHAKTSYQPYSFMNGTQAIGGSDQKPRRGATQTQWLMLVNIHAICWLIHVSFIFPFIFCQCSQFAQWPTWLCLFHIWDVAFVLLKLACKAQGTILKPNSGLSRGQTAKLLIAWHQPTAVSFAFVIFVYFEYARFFGNGVVQLWQIEAWGPGLHQCNLFQEFKHGDMTQWNVFFWATS